MRLMPRYEITVAPPPEDPAGGRTWMESTFRSLEIGDEILDAGRWLRLMRRAETQRDDVEAAFVAATAPPAGCITIDGETLDVYREDAKVLLAELARDQQAPGASEALTKLEAILGDQGSQELSDAAIAAIITAGRGAEERDVASAPLIALREALRRRA